MPNDFEISKEMAFDKYAKEHNKLASVFHKTINKNSIRDNLLTGVIGGSIFGAMFTMLSVSTNTQQFVRGQDSTVVERKSDNAKTSRDAAGVFAITLMFAILIAGIKNVTDSIRNRSWANILADDTFKDVFKKALTDYLGSNIVTDGFVERAIRATALILNNMSESKLFEFREITRKSIIKDNYGYYKINDANIKLASDIICNYLRLNMELGVNVMYIMRGDEPRTYYLKNIMEKTK